MSCVFIVGDNHLATIQTMNNLGNIYHFQRKHHEAGQMYEECLAKAIPTLGIIIDGVMCCYHHDIYDLNIIMISMISIS